MFTVLTCIGLLGIVIGNAVIYSQAMDEMLAPR
jgi:hypothetical protein